MILRGLMILVAGGVLGLLYVYGVIGTTVTQPQARIIMPDHDPADRHRITIFGTSLTSRGDWVDRLQARLQSCNARVTIDAVARPGASSKWGAGQVSEILQAADEPYDIVIYEYSGNDASLANGFPLFVSQRLHRDMIAKARSTGALVIMATMSPAWGRDAWERPGQKRYHALYRDLAATLGTGLIDTIPDWYALPEDVRTKLVPDGLHPTEDGMAEITIPAFEAALRPLVCV